MRLNLGCSDSHLDQWLNVDRVPPADQIVDLNVYPWPWETSTIEEIRAADIIEHLPNKIQTMNEAHRILIPGGIFSIEVPSTYGAGAHCDPTHVSYWNATSFEYFESGNPNRERFAMAYGITAAFRVVKIGQSHYATKYGEDVVKLHITLEAVK